MVEFGDDCSVVIGVGGGVLFDIVKVFVCCFGLLFVVVLMIVVICVVWILFFVWYNDVG